MSKYVNIRKKLRCFARRVYMKPSVYAPCQTVVFICTVEVAKAERNNKLYFVALKGGTQLPDLFDPNERNKIKILLRSECNCAIINVSGRQTQCLTWIRYVYIQVRLAAILSADAA